MKLPFMITILTLLVAIPSVGGSTPPRREVTVYQPTGIGDDSYLLPVIHDIGDARDADEQALQALQALLRSPGFRDHFPGDVDLRLVNLVDGTLFVDFNEMLTRLNAGSWRELIVVQSIVHTALSAEPGAGDLQFLIDGEVRTSLRGHVYIGEALIMDDSVVWGGIQDCHEHWAVIPISLLALRGALSIHPEDRRFHPDRTLTRAEFVEILYNAASPFVHTLQGDGEAFPLTFADIEDADLAHMVRSLVAAGFLDPSHYGEPALLKPQEPITRREAVVMTFAAADTEAARELQTAGASPDSYVRSAQHQGLLRGYPDGTHRLHAPASRAEGAALVARAMGLDSEGTQGLSIALPEPGATLRPGGPVIGVAVGESGTRLEYELKMHECQVVVSQGEVTLYPGGWFSFAPRSHEEWPSGPAYLTVSDSPGVPVLLGE